MGLDRAPIEFQTFYFFHVWLDPPNHHTTPPHHRQAAGGNRASKIVSTWPFWNPRTHRLPRPHGDWQAQGGLMSNWC